MKIGIPKEVTHGEKRVAATPSSTELIRKLGFEVLIETTAGLNAGFNDSDYEVEGATIIPTAREIWTASDIILKIREPATNRTEGFEEIDLLHNGQTLIGLLWPAQNANQLDRYAEKKVTAIAIDSVPRISRAQKFDALSSMANIAGYRAVIEAANHYGKFFGGQITAAGKIPPVTILVIGAGVAGLAAIGTAGNMGAIVRAFDTRPEVKEQVESMGANFLLLNIDEDGSGSGGYAKVMSDEFIAAEMELFSQQAREVDIIITTALIPGKPAPKLITEAMVSLMTPGSVIVDLAAEQGGNCELTQPNESIIEHGVTIVGYTDFPSRMAAQSSQLYSNNLYHLLSELSLENQSNINIDMSDDVVRSVTIAHEGAITWPPPNLPIKKERENSIGVDVDVVETQTKTSTKSRRVTTITGLAVALALIFGLGSVAPPEFMAHFTVFILAIFVGWQVIWNVTAALHTPLMSVTNAISGIIIIGALVQTPSSSALILFLAGISVLIASINISGGFLVTQRMLRMFRKEN
ncbi:MAG: NAD(P)(+) transhydrogenase (Re/Si-specific) subunit alpha [Acidiferrobacteraceae bacterium]|nr:NAD(P)(+) transhydrogenase (Re/Si-specific) subunit alpha [Acidiferrobacteraceae bacterium]